MISNTQICKVAIIRQNLAIISPDLAIILSGLAIIPAELAIKKHARSFT